MSRAAGRKWVTRFAGSVPKHSEFPASNEDRFVASDEQQRYVVSDGASESFNSALWAETIVEAWFSRRPRKSFFTWLHRAIDRYESQSDRASMSWSQEAAFARGSFASLLACEARPDSSLVITAIGDSLAVLVRDGTIVSSFPYENFEQFQQRPTLLSTIYERNQTTTIRDGIRSMRNGEECGPCHVTWRPETSGDWFVLLMTDALGQWLLDDSAQASSDRLGRLMRLSNEQELADLVEEARSEHSMRRDDSTVIVLWGREYADATAP